MTGQGCKVGFALTAACILAATLAASTVDVSGAWLCEHVSCLSSNLLPCQRQGQEAVRCLKTTTLVQAMEYDRQVAVNSAVPQRLQDVPEVSIVKNINEQLTSQEAGRMFAVVHIAGKQRKVTAEDILVVDKHIDADNGERITLNKVLLVGARDFTIVGRPVLSPMCARVEATVIEKTLSHTNVIFWYRRRENFKYMRLRRECLTYLRINSIELAPLH